MRMNYNSVVKNYAIPNININKLKGSPKDKPMTLTTNVHFVINATNKNHRLELSYGSLNVGGLGRKN